MVERLHCDNARQFLAELRLTNEFFMPFSPGEWIFRGVGDSQFTLLPSALRLSDERMSAYARGFDAGSVNVSEQRSAEQWALKHFLLQCDRAGIPLPRAFDPETLIDKDDESWPSGDQLPLLALAQHFGVPTRLLDWTLSPLVSAFFACEAWTQEPMEKRAQRVAVWALGAFVDEARRHMGFRGREYEVVSLPSEGNPHLRAQQGVMTLIREKGHADCTPNREPLEEVVARENIGAHIEVGGSNEFRPVIRQLTLPGKCVGDLMWCLAKEGITRIAVYPTLQGAATAASDEVHWHRPISSRGWGTGLQPEDVDDEG